MALQLSSGEGLFIMKAEGLDFKVAFYILNIRIRSSINYVISVCL